MRTLRLLLGLGAVVMLGQAGLRPGSTSAPSSDLAGEWSVERVVDGDTAVVRRGAQVLTVRMLGVDAPETKKPGAPVGCFGPEASAFSTNALSGRTVRLESGVEPRDRYGRTLAWVWVGEELFNRTLIEAGHARMYRPEVALRYGPLLEQAETSARNAGNGLWGACSS